MREIQPDKTAVDWPEFGSDFGVEFALLFESCHRPKLQRDQVLRTFADPVRDIRPRND